MSKLKIKKGTTSKLIQFNVMNAVTGGPLTGLAYNSSGLTAYYYREGAASATAITLATMTLGTWATGGFIVVDATNMPGEYQLGIPDAALATGASSVVIYLHGATNMAPLCVEIQLVNYDPEDGVRLGLTALPNAAAEASGGLITRGTGTGQITLASGLVSANTTQFAGQTITCSGGVTIPAATLASTTNITAGTITTTTNLTNLPSIPSDWLTATGIDSSAVTEIQAGLALAADLATVAGYLDTEIAAIKVKTDNLPASPAAVGSAMTLASGAISESTFTTPSEASGRPTGILGMLRRVFEWQANKRTRSRTSGTVSLRNEADDGNLETQTQSTSSDVDTQTKGV